MIGGMVLLLLGSLVPAFGAIPLGPFKLIPEVVLEERYDSNIFLAPSREAGDFVSYGSLELRLALPLRLTRSRIVTPFVSYFAEAAAFANHGSEDFQNQGINGGVDIDIPLDRPDQRLTFNVSNRLRSVTEVSNASEQSDIGPRTRRDENNLIVALGYFLTRLDEVHLSYNRLDITQKDVFKFLDRNENTVAVTYYHRVSPLVAGLLEYDYKFVDFTNLLPSDPDFSSTGHVLAIGIRADPNAALRGTAKLGVEIRNFERQSDATGPFAEANLEYKLTPRLLSSLLLSRAMQVTSNQEFPFFDASLVRLRFLQQFTRKISAFVTGSFELDEYKARVVSRIVAVAGDPERRLDRLYELGTGADYAFARWLTAGLSYLYRTKSSNFSRLEYVDNRVVLRLTARF